MSVCKSSRSRSSLLFLFSKTLDNHCTVEKCQIGARLCSSRRTSIARLFCSCDSLVDKGQMDIEHADPHLASSFPSLVMNPALANCRPLALVVRLKYV